MVLLLVQGKITESQRKVPWLSQGHELIMRMLRKRTPNPSSSVHSSSFYSWCLLLLLILIPLVLFFPAVSLSASARSSSSRSLLCSWEQANKNFYSCFLKTMRINGCFLMCSWTKHHLSTCLSAWLLRHASSPATLIFCFITFCSSKIQWCQLLNIFR